MIRRTNTVLHCLSIISHELDAKIIGRTYCLVYHFYLIGSGFKVEGQGKPLIQLM